MAGGTIQGNIKIDYTQVANLNPQLRAQFEELKQSLVGLDVFSKQYIETSQKMADILNGTVAPITSVNDAATKLTGGLDGLAASTKLVSESTGELNKGLSSVNKAVNGGFLDTIQKQKVAFTDVGRLVTGAGFSLRSLASNFSLLGPEVVIASALIGYFGEELYKLLTKQTDLQAAIELTNKTVAEGEAGAQGQIASIQALTGILTSETSTRKERTRAFKELQDEYPNALKNMTLENTSIEKITAATKNLTSALIRKAQIEGLQGAISAQYKEQADAIVKSSTEATSFMEQALAVGESLGLVLSTNNGKSPGSIIDQFADANKIATINKTEAAIKALNDSLVALTKTSIDEGDHGILGSKDWDKKGEEQLAKYKKSLEEFQNYIHGVNLSPIGDLHKSLIELQEHYQKLVEVAKETKQPYTQATKEMEQERLQIIKDFNSQVIGEMAKAGRDAVAVTQVTDKQLDEDLDKMLKGRLKEQKDGFEDESKLIKSGADVQLDAIKDTDAQGTLSKAENSAKRLKIIQTELEAERASAVAHQQSATVIKGIDDKITANKQDQAHSQDEINKAKLQQDIQYAQAAGNLLNSLSGMMGDSTQADKDVKIAAVSIAAITSAAKSQLLADGYFSAGDFGQGALAEAQVVAALATGAEQIAKIQAVKVPHTSAASSATGNIGGGSLSTSAPQVPSANNSTNLSAQSVQQINQTNQQAAPIRAYVAESDVTGTVNRVAGRSAANTIGGSRRH